MPNRNLTSDELELARELLKSIRERIEALANGDADLRFAYRRKIAKELQPPGRQGQGERRRGVSPVFRARACADPLVPWLCEQIIGLKYEPRLSYLLTSLPSELINSPGKHYFRSERRRLQIPPKLRRARSERLTAAFPIPLSYETD